MLEKLSLKTSSHIGNHCWPGPLGLWNKRNCCGLVEVLLLSSRFIFPCLTEKFTRTAEYLPGTLWPTRLQDWHLNLWKVWKATQQRSPWAVPGGHCACASAHKWTALAATSQLRAAAPRRCWKYNTQLPENTKHTTSCTYNHVWALSPLNGRLPKIDFFLEFKKIQIANFVSWFFELFSQTMMVDNSYNCNGTLIVNLYFSTHFPFVLLTSLLSIPTFHISCQYSWIETSLEGSPDQEIRWRCRSTTPSP